MSKEVRQFTVGADDDGIRLDRWFKRHLPQIGFGTVSKWARTGQVKKAVGTIELFNPEDELFDQLRPQLYRARAFTYAYANNLDEMRKSLKKLVAIDARILGGFLGKKTHPLLQKEAKRALERSGQVPRRTQFERR